MTRLSMLVLVAAGAALIIGCPTPDAVVPPPAGDPTTGGQVSPQLRIEPSSQILRGNSATATLRADVTGGGTLANVNWSIPAGALQFIISRDAAGNPTFSTTTTGDLVEVGVNPTVVFTAPANFNVSASATLADGTALSAVSLTIRVEQAAASSTQLLVNPTATPPFVAGQRSADTNINLAANVSGQRGAVSFVWTALDGLPLSGGTTSDTAAAIATTGLGPGVYRFRVTATDSFDGSITTGDVEFHVGDVSVGLDVRANNYSVRPGQLVTLSLDRNAGAPNFTYTLTATGGTLSAPSVTSADDATVNWLAPGTEGAVRIDVTVTDSGGRTATDSVGINVSNDALTVDARASASFVAPSQAVTITFAVSNGAPNYAYEISASGGTLSTATLTNQPGNGVITWTAPPATPGADIPYTITVIASDAIGRITTDTVTIAVGADPLGLDLRTEAGSTNSINPGETITLDFDVTGGAPAYSYVFTASGPGGAGTFTPAAIPPQAGDVTTVTWTAPVGSSDGGYRIELTVTDAFGNSASDSTWVFVSVTGGMTLDVRSDFHLVGPGSSATLALDVTGGRPNYNFAFTASGGTIAPTLLNAPDLSTIVWTAPAAAVGNNRSFEITVTATDQLGNVAVDSVWISVAAPPLSVDVRTETTSTNVINPGDTITLDFDVTGGAANYTYTYTATGPSGAGTFAPLSGALAPQAGDVATVTWTAPAGTSDGAYRLELTVVDAFGTAAVDSMWVYVSTSGGMTLDVRADFHIVPATNNATLTLDVTGGTPLFSFAFSASGGTIAANLPNVADLSTIVWTAPAAAPGNNRSFEITVTATDSVGNVAVDSVWISVQAAPLTVDLRSDAGSTNVINPGDAITLDFDVTGGAPNYTYTYTATGPGGAGVFNPVSPLAAQAGDVTTVTWTAPSGAVDGAYRLELTATDAFGTTAVDSMWIFVSTTGGMDLDIRATRYQPSVGGGQTSTLTLDVTGGSTTYTYTLVEFNDPAGGAVASPGTYLQTFPVAGAAGDGTVTFDPDGGAGGGDDLAVGVYTIVVQVTDSVGNIARDTIAIEVVP